jgi:hypothetical protein
MTSASYLYSVLPASASAPPVEGVLPHVTVEAVAFGPLTVLTSLVPRALFDNADPSNRTGEPEWMAARIAAHHAVNAASTARGPCLPLAFGSLFSSLSLVRQWLLARQPALLEALARVSGRAEWVVSIREDVAARDAWLCGHDPALKHLAAAVAAAGEGTAYLLSRRLEKAKAAAKSAQMEAVTEIVSARLAEAGFTLTERPSAAGPPKWTVLAPFGADGSDEPSDDLAALTRELQAEWAPAGLTPRLSGPWPAYGFARHALAREELACG